MNPETWYKVRLVGLILAVLMALLASKLHANWIGLHPPELDILYEDIVEEYKERIENQGLTDKEVEEVHRKEKEEQDIREETYRPNRNEIRLSYPGEKIEV